MENIALEKRLDGLLESITFKQSGETYTRIGAQLLNVSRIITIDLCKRMGRVWIVINFNSDNTPIFNIP